MFEGLRMPPTSPTLALVVEQERLGLFFWQDDDMRQMWYPFDRFQVHGLAIFNPTLIAQAIRVFLAGSRLDRGRAIISLDGSCLDESLMYEEPGCADEEGYSISTQQLADNCWYRVAIPYALRAQYHLLALAVPVRLTRITTATLAYHALFSRPEISSDSALVSLSTLKAVLQCTYRSTNDTPAYTRSLHMLAYD